MRIVIVDDDSLVCLSLKTILSADEDIEVVASGSNGREAISLYKQYQPDILLMDIQMGEHGGLEAGEKILNLYKNAKILYLTTFTDNEYVIKAIKIGAKGYIIKQDTGSIIPALKAVYSGQNVFGSEIVSKIPQFIEQNGTPSFEDYNLTDREREIIGLVAKGDNNKEIAQALYLSEGTVRNHISTILDKLSLRDRTQLAVFYYRSGQ